VAEAALQSDGVTHITLTTGTQEDEVSAFKHLASCVQAIKERTGLPVHLQFMPPQDFSLMEDLKEAGVDTVGIHIESFDPEVWLKVCPAKALIGIKRYQECWKVAVDLFGKNQVSSFIILGLGEERCSLREGSEMLCEMGVYPYLLPLRPLPHTGYSSATPPDPEYTSSVYQEVATLLSRHQLSWKEVKAGCVRCGSCSAINHFENN
jgi:radical SAM protein (TIGR04043 family)